MVCATVVGCGTAPTCNVSPVEIEELREDVAVVQKNLATARERQDNLEKELATKQADLATKKGKPDELRAQLEAMRKGSGRLEKPKADAKSTTKPAAPTTPPKKEQS
jgi:chromosome segregation ATPase